LEPRSLGARLLASAAWPAGPLQLPAAARQHDCFAPVSLAAPGRLAAGRLPLAPRRAWPRGAGRLPLAVPPRLAGWEHAAYRSALGREPLAAVRRRCLAVASARWPWPLAGWMDRVALSPCLVLVRLGLGPWTVQQLGVFSIFIFLKIFFTEINF